MNVRRLSLLLAAVLALGASPAARADELVDRIAAVVNGKVITLSQVEKHTQEILDRVSDGTATPDKRRATERQALKDLEDEQLIEGELEAKNIEVTADDVDRAIEQVRSQNGMTLDQFKQALVGQGYTWKGYRKNLKKQLARYKLMRSEVQERITVSAEDIQSYLKQHGEAQGSMEIRARHILIRVPKGASPKVVEAAREKAVKAMQRVTRGGESFAKVAREVSQDPGTAKDGGDLGWFGHGDMLPAFEKAAYATKPGQVTGPVRTRFGWHVIQVEATRLKTTSDEKQKVEQARQVLTQQALQKETHRYLEALRRRAVIEVKVKDLKG